MLEPSLNQTNKWLIFAFVAIGVFMSTLDGSIVNIALPTIMTDLSADFSIISWVIMIYLMTVTSFLLCFGRLSDIIGRRKVFIAGLLTFAAGSFCCAVSINAWSLIASRAFQGLGAAMIMACSPALITDTFQASERGKAMGAIGTIVAAGLTAGPALGGWLLTYFSWRVIFYINIPIGIVAALVVYHLLKNTNADIETPEPFDWYGAILLVMTVAFFLIYVTRGSNSGYLSMPMVCCAFGAVIALFCLVAWESRVEFPILDLSVFKIRLFTLPVVSAVFLFMTLFTMIFLMPFFLMMPCGLTEARAGYMMMIPFAFLFVVSPVSGIISDKIGSRVLCTIGMGVLALALFSMTFLTPESSMIAIGWRMALSGLGASVFLPPNSATVMTAVMPKKRGVAGGVVAAARNLGMVIGVAVAGAVFNHVYSDLTGGANVKTYSPAFSDYFMYAFKAALNTGACFGIVGMILAALRGPDSKLVIPEKKITEKQAGKK